MRVIGPNASAAAAAAASPKNSILVVSISDIIPPPWSDNTSNGDFYMKLVNTRSSDPAAVLDAWTRMRVRVNARLAALERNGVVMNPNLTPVQNYYRNDPYPVPVYDLAYLDSGAIAVLVHAPDFNSQSDWRTFAKLTSVLVSTYRTIELIGRTKPQRRQVILSPLSAGVFAGGEANRNRIIDVACEELKGAPDDLRMYAWSDVEVRLFASKGYAVYASASASALPSALPSAYRTQTRLTNNIGGAASASASASASAAAAKKKTHPRRSTRPCRAAVS